MVPLGPLESIDRGEHTVSNDNTHQTRRRLRLGHHLRRNLVAYLALFIAVSMTPLPSWAAGQITSKQIKNNTIKSVDVKNNNLQGVDIADGSLSGADVADGAIATADLAASARGYTSTVTKRQVDAAVANAASSTLTVVCGAGQVAIGGGAYVVFEGLNFTGITGGIIEASHPTRSGTNIFDTTSNFPAGDGVAPDGWKTTVRNDQGVTKDAVHYAICASK
jgi:hypothetical protein